MPSWIYISKEETTASGFNAAKDCLTLLLGGNAYRNCKIKPLLVYHSENPNPNKSNMKAWVTKAIFKIGS